MSEHLVPDLGRVLGFDLGTVRIGVAVCDRDQRLATGVVAVSREGDRRREHRRLADLVGEYEAVGVVVGLPRSMSGGIGPAARAALAEVEVLRHDLGVPVDTVDERLTTVSATAALHAGGRDVRKGRSVVDQVAAAVLLQSWLDRRSAPAVTAGA